jgi:triacylglycerol esterase/lipase EstA (alpha/beta hydrolase family)
MTKLRLFLLLLVLSLSHCGTPSAPKCHFMPWDSREPSAVYIEQARRAWNDLGTDPDAEAQYNDAIRRLFNQITCGNGKTIQAAESMGTLVDDRPSLGTGLRISELDNVFPASRVDTGPVGQRYSRAGIGLPVVGWQKTAEEGKPRWEFAPPTGVPLNLTAILRFDHGKPPTWSFTNPGRVQQIRTPAGMRTQAADWSAAGAFYWHMSNLDDLDIAKALEPSRFNEETKLYLSTPYDAKKIPVIMVHGVNSSPGTFKKLCNRLNSQDWFREHYQIWFFSYPTGNNWTYSAARFRQEISNAEKFVRKKGPAPNWDHMVLIGHSMGGVICHASLKNPGDTIYKAFSIGQMDTVVNNAQAREAMKLLTMYQPLKEPDTAIFLAAPHQGSPMADRFFSNIVAKMIRLPKTLTIDAVDFTLNDLTSLLTSGQRSRDGWCTCVGSLSPSYPAYKALKAIPFPRGVKTYSIIGDRGRGDTPDSSDGVVPYWSSHLDGVQRETIVPSYHSVPSNPECAEEVSRILRERLRR